MTALKERAATSTIRDEPSLAHLFPWRPQPGDKAICGFVYSGGGELAPLDSPKCVVCLELDE